MSGKRIETLLKQRSALLKELGQNAWLLRGTWVERYSTCMRQGCKCHQGEQHGPRHYIAIIRDGKQRQVYVRRQHEELVRAGLSRSQTIDDILLQITEINLDLLKVGAYDNDV